jgi:DNA-binding transcriptional ArsR family regulator
VDPRRPARAAGNVVGLELRSEEKQLLREAGRFRVVRTADLRETLYNGKAGPLENDLKYLRDKGLVETAHINLRRDGQRRTMERVEVVTLTKDGRSLLVKQGGLPQDQKVYAGLVKPREAEHDSQIYRAYRKEAERIEAKGGGNLRVRLDFEIKADVQKAIYAERKADPKRDMAEIKQQVAEKFELPFVDGKIQIPDARIDYDLPREAGQDSRLDQDQGSRTGHEDIEVLTAAYHAGHLRAKAQAGFRNYASNADRATLTAKIEGDHHLMENILEL